MKNMKKIYAAIYALTAALSFEEYKKKFSYDRKPEEIHKHIHRLIGGGQKAANMNKIFAAVNAVEVAIRIAADFDTYKKEHPGTKKTESDPLFNPEKHDYSHFNKVFGESFDKHHDALHAKDFFGHGDGFKETKKRWDAMTPEEKKFHGVPTEEALNDAQAEHVDRLKKEFKQRMHHGVVNTTTHTTRGGFGDALHNLMAGIHGEKDVSNVANHIANPNNKLSRHIFEDLTGKKLPKTQKGTAEVVAEMAKKKKQAKVANHSLKFFSGPGHGWLEVPMSVYKESGITASRYSYYSKKKNMVYLEEDSDAPKFEDAMKKKGIPVHVTSVHMDDESPIRNLGPMPGY